MCGEASAVTSDALMRAGLDALFEPAGVIVAGASPHPGRFGTVALHNLLASEYEGRVFATRREGGAVLGVETVQSVDAESSVDCCHDSSAESSLGSNFLTRFCALASCCCNSACRCCCSWVGALIIGGELPNFTALPFSGTLLKNE